MNRAKPFSIPKRLVWEAYKRIKANGGAAGVDDESIEQFERNLKDNLYKLWNRMSSGSYFPPPVKRVEISKRDGGKRPLGIPTVSDRIAQAVVKAHLEPKLEVHFHPNSYGYRPGKSALEAIRVARERCWRHDWVLDLDVRAYFDTIPHDLLIKAVRKHTDCPWVLLYTERWLAAPVELSDGTLEFREKGTPQGSVISPLLSNLFLHYTFDRRMALRYPSVPFERFADDIICHCRSEAQARWLHGELTKRFLECGLELHPQKTKIVYCKDDNRRGDYLHESFDFLGYCFRPRLAQSNEGVSFVSFSPGISNTAAKEVRHTVREWRLRSRASQSLDDLARNLNPAIRGWIMYYGRYYRSALYPTLRCIDRQLLRWAMTKYKRLRRRRRCAANWLRRLRRRESALFAHWCLLPLTTAGQ